MYLNQPDKDEAVSLARLKNMHDFQVFIDLLDKSRRSVGNRMDVANGLQEVGKCQGARGVLQEIIDQVNHSDEIVGRFQHAASKNVKKRRNM